MRGLIKRRGEEGGAVAVIVAMLMVVLLGFIALAVDVGLLYAEKAQLQNGSDAAALAIAEDCAEDDSCPADPTDLAKSYADDNANDGLTNVQDVTFDSQTVTVTTGALQEGGEANQISLYFAKLLGIENAEVGATTIAKWGPPVGGPAPFPVAFSECEVNVDGSLQVIQARKSTNPDCEAIKIPGGFGWMEEKDGPCVVEHVETGPFIPNSNPGNNVSGECQDVLEGWAEKLESGQNVIALLPVFTEYAGGGSTATYTITGFAAYDVKGWHLKQNTNKYPEEYNPTVTIDGVTVSCTGKCIGIIGKFVRHVELGEAYELGLADDYGVNIVSLTLEDES